MNFGTHLDLFMKVSPETDSVESLELGPPPYASTMRWTGFRSDLLRSVSCFADHFEISANIQPFVIKSSVHRYVFHSEDNEFPHSGDNADSVELAKSRSADGRG